MWTHTVLLIHHKMLEVQLFWYQQPLRKDMLCCTRPVVTILEKTLSQCCLFCRCCISVDRWLQLSRIQN